MTSVLSRKKQSLSPVSHRYAAFVFVMLAAVLFSGAGVSSSPTPFYGELTIASMRMGWSQGFLEYYRGGAAVMVASEIDAASASLVLAQAELPWRYQQAFALDDYNSRMEADLTPRAHPVDRQVAQIKSWWSRVYQRVSYYLDSSTGQFVYHSTCSAYYVNFGYWYGRAYAAAYAGLDNRAEIQEMQRSVRGGMKKDNCAFLLEDAWLRLGMIDGAPARARPLSFFTGNFTATIKAIRAFGSRAGEPTPTLTLPIVPGIPQGTPPVPVAPPPDPTAAWSGKWQSVEFGTLTLSQTGDEVTGTFLRRDGKLSGTVNGYTLTGRWEERDGEGQGDFVFSLTEDGQGFDTRWRFDGEEGWKAKPGDGTRR